MTVNVEIISIGNELLIGKIQNTNAYWLSQQITALGASVQRETIIPDVIPTIAECIREAAARKSHFIITTGGLGPTFDDKTMQAAAVALGQKVVVNPEALKFVKTRIAQYFKERGEPTEFQMNPPRLKMAMLPKNAQVVENPIGTAPAMRAVIGESELYVLPGIPREMGAIFTETIAPRILEAAGSEVFAQRSLFVEEIESKLAPLIDRVMADNVGVYVKSHPMGSDGRPKVELHLTMTDAVEKNPVQSVAKAARELSALILAGDGVILGEA